MGEGWKCLVCLGSVSVNDQHRADGGSQAPEVGVGEIGDELEAGGVAGEEGASDEDGQTLSFEGVGVAAVRWCRGRGGGE